jgi:hypothetical protein
MLRTLAALGAVALLLSQSTALAQAPLSGAPVWQGSHPLCMPGFSWRQACQRWAPLQRGQVLAKCLQYGWGCKPTPIVR